ncbi:MAG TPA: hypothetical protein VES20_05100 [Bryobacteraceae bacterium]|nr:hypothetical protein [Bryobacteraceae bacterium]
MKLETVVAWHRKAFRFFWTWNIRRGKPGRPPVPREVRDLIRRMSKENPVCPSNAQRQSWQAVTAPPLARRRRAMSREMGSRSVVIRSLLQFDREFVAEVDGASVLRNLQPGCPGHLLHLNARARLSPCVLLCRFPQQVSQRQTNPGAGPANKALRLRLGAGPLAVRLPPEQTGSRKGELRCTR